MANPDAVYVEDNTRRVSFLDLEDPSESTPTQQVENITRPGVDGQAYRRRGRRGQSYQLRGVVDLVDEEAVELMRLELGRLSGPICRVKRRGIVIENQVLRTFRVTSRRKTLLSVGGLTGHRTSGVSARVTLELLDLRIDQIYTVA